MEETKIWVVEGISAKQLESTNRMETEGQLEEILTANPDMLEEGLQLVGRQTSTAGGPLDLLGVDTDGRLVVFELKRGTLNREAVAQVIDYASDLNSMDLDRLKRHIAERSGNFGIQKIEDFGEWYGNNWPEEGIESLMPPRMVLVGLGVDNTTERMVEYLASGNMDISLLTFHGFVSSDGKALLARHVEVASEVIKPTGTRNTRNRRAQFEERVQALPMDIRNILDDAERMFKNQIRGFSQTYANTWINFNLDYSWHEESALKRVATLFIEIDEAEKGVRIGFHPIAIHMASTDEFKSAGIEFETAEPRVIVRLGIDHEVRFPLYSLDEWEQKREKLTALTRKVWEAYDTTRAKAISNH